MSGITLKIASLFVRTLSKPIANRIKAQAREHEGFRRLCVSMAQSIHRIDMRLRLGLLQDPAAIERQLAREAKEAAAKKAKAEIPTVKTESQTKADELAAAREKEKGTDKASKKPRIRPLTEAKAIETGANFISESFIFSVALGLIFVERWYSITKEQNRRSDLADKLAELEARDAEHGKTIELLKHELDEIKGKDKSHWFWSKDKDQTKASLPPAPKESAESKPKESKPEEETKPLEEPPKTLPK